MLRRLRAYVTLDTPFVDVLVKLQPCDYTAAAPCGTRDLGQPPSTTADLSQEPAPRTEGNGDSSGDLDGLDASTAGLIQRLRSA